MATGAVAAATGGEDAVAASTVAAAVAAEADREAGTAAATAMGCQGGMAASHMAVISNDFIHVVSAFFFLVYIVKKIVKNLRPTGFQ